MTTSVPNRMPAEWEPHEATLLAWPYNIKTWGVYLEAAERTMAEVISHLVKGERVDLLVAHEGVEARARKLLDPLKLTDAQLRYLTVESGDVWIRDYGPIFVQTSAGRAWVKNGYNAYGKPEEYADLLPGNDVPIQLPYAKEPHTDSGMILEGGSIDVNGSGTLITTESCLLSPTRNPTMNKQQIEEKLHALYGCSNILWLSDGIEGDDTTGHVDDLTRFVSRTCVVTVTEENQKDPNFVPLQENLQRLKSMKLEDGTSLEVRELPMPKEYVLDGRRMAASYANFYIANAAVLVPVYNQPSDAQALRVLQGCFPDKPVIGINSKEFIWGFGSIHCSTQQVPVIV